jgi:hypothetical protein
MLRFAHSIAQAMPAIIFRGVLPVTVLAGLMLVLEPSPALGVDKTVMIEFGMFLCGIIGVAAVMRVDVGRLVHWQTKHVESHVAVAEAIAKLTTIAEETGRRLARLEDEEDAWRRQQ